MGHAGAVTILNKKCEDCGLNAAYFGLPSDRGRSGPLASSLGLPAEGKKRWCTGCAKGHKGAASFINTCEDCFHKFAIFGLPSDGKKRWRGGCGKRHAGAVNIKHKKCEGCGLKGATFGLPADWKARWWDQHGYGRLY
jgi:hypothetical protein